MTTAAARRAPAKAPMFRPTRPHYELQLSPSPDLPKRFGDRIRAVSGHYTECRSGYTDKRFVHVPATRRGRALADELLAAFPYGSGWTTPKPFSTQSVVICRLFPRVQGTVSKSVSTIAEIDRCFRKHARAQFDAGKLPRPQTAAERDAEALSRAERHVLHLRRELSEAELKLQTLRRKAPR